MIGTELWQLTMRVGRCRVVLRGFPQASLGFDDHGLLLDGLDTHGLDKVVLLLGKCRSWVGA